MSYRFRRKERLAPGLRRILRKQIDRATGSIETATEDPGEAVHEVRKTVKKIRAGLRLVRSRLEPECYERENGLCRQAAHLLGGARDATVALETLERVSARLEGQVESSALEEAQARLRDLKRGALLAMMADDGPLSQAGALLTEAREGLRALPSSPLRPRDLAEGLASSFGRGRAHRDDAYRGGDPADFHAWRRRSKDLWHQLQLVEAAWPPVLRARASEHHKLADHLGLANDFVNLDERLSGDPALIPDAEVRDAVQEECRSLRKEAWEGARPLGLRLYAESPRTFEALLRVYLEDTFRAA